MKPIKSFTFLALSLMAVQVSAQNQTIASARSESRLLRQDLLRVDRIPSTRSLTAQAAQQGVQTSISAGAAYTDGDGYSTWDTPLLLAFAFPSGWRASISTLGYESTDYSDHKADGWTDIKFKGAYVFKVDAGSVSVGAAARMPSRGEVGSDHWQQEVSISYRGEQGNIVYSIAGAFKHNSGDQMPGVSAYPRYGAVSLGRDFGGDRVVSVQLDRFYIPGRAGISTVGIAYDFPIASIGPTFASTLSLTKGISPSDRSTSVGFDLGYSF